MASDLPLYDVFVPQKVPPSKISDDVIAYDFGLGPQSKILATPMHGAKRAAFRAVPPKLLLVFLKRELTFLLAQEDQQTFAQKRITTNAFL